MANMEPPKSTRELYVKTTALDLSPLTRQMVRVIHLRDAVSLRLKPDNPKP